jgi:hypothetical protein
MLVVVPREIDAGLTGIGDDDADAPHLDDGLRGELDRGEQAVDVVRALDHHLELPAAAAAGGEEAVGILEIIVIGLRVLGVVADHGSDDLAGTERRPVMHGENADFIFGVAEDDGTKAVAVARSFVHKLGWV